MKTVEMLEAFSSYPNGKDERAWTKGQEAELSDAHADLLIGKGLAREKLSGAKASNPAAPEPKDEDK